MFFYALMSGFDVDLYFMHSNAAFCCVPDFGLSTKAIN